MQKSEFKIVEGNHVPNLKGIGEGYCVEKKSDNRLDITINVSAEKIDTVFRALCSLVRTPGFLLLEHGTNIKSEEKLRKSDNDPFHKDIYYLDGLELSEFMELYGKYAHLLINDGEINFGFGSHDGLDEVFVGTYKVFTILTDDIEKYRVMLDNLGYKEKKEYENSP